MSCQGPRQGAKRQQTGDEADGRILGFQKKFASDFGHDFLSQFSSNLFRPVYRRKAHVIARVMTDPFFRFRPPESIKSVKGFW